MTMKAKDTNGTIEKHKSNKLCPKNVTREGQIKLHKTSNNPNPAKHWTPRTLQNIGDNIGTAEG